MSRPFVITGGGTGGHVFPMQAIAEALLAGGVSRDELRYVGSRRGQERTLLAGDIALTLLPGRGVRRSLQPRDLAITVGAVTGLVIACARAFVQVGYWRPRCVISVGGYASFATSLAAVCWRRPLVLVNLDATPPATHRVLARFATRTCVALGETEASTVVTGAPVRDEIATIDRSASARLRAREAFDPPISASRNVVVVMSGSLGATSVNRATLSVASTWATRRDITLIHVTGRRDFADISAKAPECGELDYRIEAFGDMTKLWAVADVAVCRAGATTIAELTTLGIPAVLVPLPGAPGDHQTVNARAIVDGGGAVLIPDAQVSAETLADALSQILAPVTHAAMSAATRRLAHEGAAHAIARVALESAR